MMEKKILRILNNNRVVFRSSSKFITCLLIFSCIFSVEGNESNTFVIFLSLSFFFRAFTSFATATTFTKCT